MLMVNESEKNTQNQNLNHSLVDSIRNQTHKQHDILKKDNSRHISNMGVNTAKKFEQIKTTNISRYGCNSQFKC